MTQHHARSLSEIYKIIESIQAPKAICDFVSGEMGNEVLLAQSLGGKFYDKHHQKARVIALTWEGCGILYRNVSHDQIELASPEISSEWNKNRYTTGEQRFNWLIRQQHMQKISGLSGVKARLGPFWLSCGMTIGGYSNQSYFFKGGFHYRYGRYWRLALDRLGRTNPIFDTGPSRIKGPYLSLFDRHERHDPKRNTQLWQIRLFHRWAEQLGCKLVVISGLYPRSLPEGIIRIHSPHRDMFAMANVVQHSLLHGAPASGAGELAMVLGCNFVQFGDSSSIGFDLYNPLMFAPILRGRGYEHFGIFDAASDWSRRWKKNSPHNEKVQAACYSFLKNKLSQTKTYVTPYV